MQPAIRIFMVKKKETNSELSVEYNERNKSCREMGNEGYDEERSRETPMALTRSNRGSISYETCFVCEKRRMALQKAFPN